ncbi:MAG TPA: right-handed parallel beta-helix repeat-containing protein, partial [Flavobacteriales bacterium]|nr:right-handed parallel beta-helix repeat-containing protein [Flavobacteriales bacterium]
MAGFPTNGTGNGTAGVEFAVSTVGYTGINVLWDQRQGQTGSRYFQLSYSINGITFITTGLPAPLGPGTEGIVDLYPSTGGTNPGFDNGILFDLTGLASVHGNSNFKVRITAVFQPPGTTYLAARHLSTYTTAGTARFDMITVTGLVDTDGDSVADATDNCPTTPNTDQADVDSDGDGNSCDNCLFAVNSGQEDADTDGLGDVCDNCPNDANGAQDDGDNDNVGDACDACPTNGNLPVGPNGCPTSIYVNDGNTGDDVVTTAAGNDATGDGTSAAPFATIMHAMGLVPDGGTIIVDGGTYTEQVSNGGKSVTITGQGIGVSILNAPVSLSSVSTPSAAYSTVWPIVYATGSGKTVNISGLTISGAGGRDLGAFFGVYYYEAGGAFTNNRLTAIRWSTLNGVQSGRAFVALHNTGVSLAQSITFSNNTIDDYQKSGVILYEPGLSTTVSNNTITWSGIAGLIAANGITLGRGASASITGNIISGNIYGSDPLADEAAGILLVGAANPTTITGNTISGTQGAILADDIGAPYGPNLGVSISGNTFSNNLAHERIEPSMSPGTNSYDKRVDNAAQTQNVFGSIQYAIDAGADGDVLTASAGTFTENVTVNKANMTLNGAQAGNARCTPATESTIDGGTGTAVTIAADGVTLNGFHLDAKTGVSSTGFSGATISYNLVDADLYGIAAQGMTTGHTVSNNCVDMSQQFDGPTPTAGIALVGSGTAPTVASNTVKDGYYGYVLYGMPATTTVSGGAVSGAQLGVAISNSTATAAPWGTLLPSDVTVSGVNMNGFAGAAGAQVGVYTFTAPGTVPAEGLNVSVTGCTIDGTGKPVQNSAAIGFEDYSGGGVTVQNVSVANSTLTNNHNRGINVRGRVVADIDGSVLTNNGYDAFGSGGNDGLGVLVSEDASATVNNCIINN